MNEWINFNKGNEIGDQARSELMSWWHGLSPKDSADLRRCRTSAEVVETRPYYNLVTSLKKLGRVQTNKLPGAVLLLAQVKKYTPEQVLPRQLGQVGLKDIQFRLLLRTSSPEQRVAMIRRWLPRVKYATNILFLTQAMISWGPGSRRKWAEQFYQVENTNQ